MGDSATLKALRRRIDRIDSGCSPQRRRSFGTGNTDLDSALQNGLEHGRLHELYALDVDDAPSAAGFAAMLALRMQASPLVWLRTEAAERAAGQLYMPGWTELGGDPASVIMVLLPDDGMLLRTAVDAAACSGLSAVVMEFWGKAPLLTLTASRRLALAAEKSGVTLLLLRIDASPIPSAATTRWSISAAPSITMAAATPGHSMIEVELLRQRSGPAEMRWQMEWKRDEGTFRKPEISGVVASVAEHRTADSNRKNARRSA